jgi:hypothetical protein
MGFTKTYVTKDSVLRYLRESTGDITHLKRQVNVEMLIGTDATVMDSWCDRFFSTLRPEEREVRRTARESSPNQLFCREKVLSSLESPSEALISLLSDPIPEDYVIAMNGKFPDPAPQDMTTYCINILVAHFDRGH